MTRMFPVVLDAGTESDATLTILTRQVRIPGPAQTSNGDREEYDCQNWEIWAQLDALVQGRVTDSPLGLSKLSLRSSMSRIFTDLNV